MSDSPPKSAQNKNKNSLNHLQLITGGREAEVLALLPPGSFAKFENQPSDLPPFQVIHCKGGRCWVKQQAWGRNVHWEVEHHRLHTA